MASLRRKQDKIEWDDMDKRKFLPYYGMFQLAMRASLHPYNLIKTRLMDKHSVPQYRGTIDCFLQVVRQEGFSAVYRGFSVQCLHLGTTLIYITTYTYTRKIISRRCADMNDFSLSMLSGSLAALTCQLVGVPIDVVSQYMMVNRTAAKLVESPLMEEVRTLPTLCRIIYRNNGGTAAFYSGFLASILTFVPHSACLWGFYSLYTDIFVKLAPPTVPLLALQACAGPLAAMSSVPFSHPMDLVRVRVQLHQSPNIRSAFKDIIFTEGIGGFTRGMFARTLLQTQGSVIMLLCYETVKRLSLRRDENNDSLSW